MQPHPQPPVVPPPAPRTNASPQPEVARHNVLGSGGQQIGQLTDYHDHRRDTDAASMRTAPPTYQTFIETQIERPVDSSSQHPSEAASATPIAIPSPNEVARRAILGGRGPLVVQNHSDPPSRTNSDASRITALPPYAEASRAMGPRMKKASRTQDTARLESRIQELERQIAQLAAQQTNTNTNTNTKRNTNTNTNLPPPQPPSEQ
ncbi:uncharacterized protein LOC62_05G007703 [Vanrija pseudolonga]|uniref:Uncharacterized protein n=1 Tax=Vanrija pseudolonga TaxID=143232 RepID=A0AAF0YCF4_9TREE|nr:hypothetical protein LOC62_05G007703 [Vanrija pseudolonga]